MEKDKNNQQFKATAPYFLVKDLNQSLDYYHQMLGFSRPRLWGNPPTFAMPVRDGFVFMLKQVDPGFEIVPNRSQSGYWDAYIWIENADTLFAEMREAGAMIEYEPTIQEGYGIKEFAVRDPDGHIIAFGQEIEP